jgi:hypothetical protein
MGVRVNPPNVTVATPAELNFKKSLLFMVPLLFRVSLVLPAETFSEKVRPCTKVSMELNPDINPPTSTPAMCRSSQLDPLTTSSFSHV